MDADYFLPKIMDLLLDAVCVVDAHGRFIFVNAACERIFGYTPVEMIGRNMIELVHPDDRERTLQTASEIMQGKPQLHFENRYVRKDGKIVHIMWSARWSEADGLRLAVARDITALKHAERMQRALYQISEAAHTVQGLADLYPRIHKIIAELLPVENFCVALYDKLTGMLSFPYFIDTGFFEASEMIPEPQALASNSLIASVIQGGKAVLITATDQHTAIPGTDSVAQADKLDWLGVPLVTEEGTVGALVVKTESGASRYTEEDKQLLQFVSAQIAAAIKRKQTENRLLYMARHDALTDLPNRTLFNDCFDVALKRAHRDGEHLALLYLDLDGFKEVNDTCGHEVGDNLLRELADRLADCVRESDTIGRMGGDEFTILLTNIQDPADTDVIVQKIQTAILTPFRLNGQELSISASIGTAVYPEHGEEREALFRYADARMYAVKRRNDNGAKRLSE